MCMVAALGLLFVVGSVAPAAASAANGTLDVSIEGSGSGEVVSLGEGIFETSPPIACDYESPGPATGVCEAELANEEGVFGAWVKAIPDPGSEFTGWVVVGAINQIFCEEPEAKECLVNNEAEEETEIEITATFAAAAGPNGTLDVSIEGSGSGEVVSLGEGIFETSPPIACDYESPGPATGVCEAELANEEGVFGAWVKAIPDPGSEFTGWVVVGAINQIFCEEPEAKECLVNNEAEEETEIEITATFAAAAGPNGTLDVSIEGSGSGEVVSLGEGIFETSPPIACDYESPGPATGVCEAELANEEGVFGAWVKAIPDPGSEFTGWVVVGAINQIFCEEPEAKECLVNNEAEEETEIEITATFAAAAGPNGTLDVSIEGSGSGEVVSLGEGIFETSPPIACDYESPGPATGVCEAELANEEGVFGAWVKAIPDPGSEFTGWVVVGAINQIFCEEPEAKECLVNNEAEEETEIEITATFVAVGAPPTVTSVAPNQGSTAGGTAVTITGTDLTGATEVKYGTTAVTCTGVVATCKVESPTEIKATTPAHAAGTVNVRVVTPNGESPVNAPGDQFTFVAPPTVTSVAPNQGPTAGGTAVTITGTNLTGATEVKYGTTAVTCTGVVATCKVESPTEIKATTPAHAAGTVNVRVVTPGGESAVNAPGDQFTFIAPPTVTSVAPNQGPTAGGTAVTITGTDLTGATEVKYGTTAVTCTGVVATCKVESPTEIKATTPAHAAGTVNVRVVTPGGESAVNAPGDQFTFIAPPTVTSVAPNQGPTAGGTAVTITGTDLTGATEVKYGTTAVTCTGVVATCKVESPTEIKATTPAHAAGTVNVRVVTPGGESAVNAPGDQFTFVVPPTVTNVAPNQGPTAGGTAVTITGTDLTGATEVKYGTTAVTCTGVVATCKVESPTEIKATTPVHVAGAFDVRVVTPGGESPVNAPGDQFTFVAPPAVTALDPTNGPTAGGNAVEITGLRLTAASKVEFGTTVVDDSEFSENTDTTIRVNAPAHAAGTVDVRVTTLGGTSGNFAEDNYTYEGPAALMIGKAGSGSGSVTCDGGACASTYAFGSKVTLAAAASSGSTFAGWSGACSGTGACVVTMDAAKEVTATFNADPPSKEPEQKGTPKVFPKASFSGGKAALKITCEGAGPCDGTVTLKAKVKGKMKVIGKATFSIGAGGTKTIKVKITNNQVKAKLKEGKTVNVKLSGGPGLNGTTVKLKLS